MIHWYATYSIVVEPCNCNGYPQCYVCNSTTEAQCDLEKEIVTCSRADVSVNKLILFHFVDDANLVSAVAYIYEIQNAVTPLMFVLSSK